MWIAVYGLKCVGLGRFHCLKGPRESLRGLKNSGPFTTEMFQAARGDFMRVEELGILHDGIEHLELAVPRVVPEVLVLRQTEVEPDTNYPSNFR